MEEPNRRKETLGRNELKGNRKGKQMKRERRGCRKREWKWKKRKETLGRKELKEERENRMMEKERKETHGGSERWRGG